MKGTSVVILLLLVACSSSSKNDGTNGGGTHDTVQGVTQGAYVGALTSSVGALATKSAGAGGLELQTYADDGVQCDYCNAVTCVSNCGTSCCAPPEPPPSGTCGSAGQCACNLQTYFLIGQCASRPPNAACTYCPPGTRLTDPCGTECQVVDTTKVPPPAGEHCPKSFPLSCRGSKLCCPDSHPACCANGLCGKTAADCSGGDPAASSGGGGGGGGGGGATADCATVCDRFTSTCSGTETKDRCVSYCLGVRNDWMTEGCVKKFDDVLACMVSKPTSSWCAGATTDFNDSGKNAGCDTGSDRILKRAFGCN